MFVQGVHAQAGGAPVQGGVFGGHHGAGGHRRYRMPLPPESSPGRVIISVDTVFEGFDTDASKFVPNLVGNRGYILNINKDWLTPPVLDDLMQQLTEFGQGDNNDRPSVKPMQSMGMMFGKVAIGMFILFAVMAAMMFYLFHNGSTEVIFLPIVGFGCILLLAGCAFRSQGSLMSNLFSAFSKLSKERALFATQFSQTTGLDLRYVQGRSSPEYFELSQGYEASSASSESEDNFFGNNSA